MFSKKSRFILTGLILLVLILLTYQSIKGKWHFSYLPSYPIRIVSHGVYKVINHAEEIFHTYILVIGKEEENRRLRKRIQFYEEKMNQYIETELENIRLRGLLELDDREAVRVTAAEVLARDPSNWFQILWINKGLREGIEKDMIAVTPSGIVGRVHNVYAHRSSILLITDVNSAVAVRIQKSRVNGILMGRAGGSCILKYIQKESPISVGDRIVTSGLDGLFPEGLLVGSVKSVLRSDSDLFQEIEIIPSQDIGTVEEVAILKR